MGPRFSFKAQLRFGLGSGWAFVIRFGVPEGQSFLLNESLINLNSTHRVLFSTWDIPQMVVFQLFLKNGYIFLKKIVYTHAQEQKKKKKILYSQNIHQKLYNANSKLMRNINYEFGIRPSNTKSKVQYNAKSRDPNRPWSLFALDFWSGVLRYYMFLPKSCVFCMAEIIRRYAPPTSLWDNIENVQSSPSSSSSRAGKFVWIWNFSWWDRIIMNYSHKHLFPL